MISLFKDEEKTIAYKITRIDKNIDSINKMIIDEFLREEKWYSYILEWMAYWVWFCSVVVPILLIFIMI